MRLRIILLLVSVNSCSIAFAQDDAASLVKNAQSISLEYREWTSKDTLSCWEVRFSGNEIRTLEKLLSKAKPYEHKGLILYITSYHGELNTKKRNFSIRIGEQKLAGRPVLFLLRDNSRPKSRQMYRLLDDDAREFTKLFDNALRAKTRNVKPDRIL